jgi:LAO/AO transport system kinase
VSKTNEFIEKIKLGDFRTIAKAITMVENDLEGSEALLLNLKANPKTKVIGITGPPGAGKSTLVNALLKYLTHTTSPSQEEHTPSPSQEGNKIAVLSVDPSSPFNLGALLGDRIRMSDFYLNENVFIRSLASRGSLGGLNAKIIEIIDVVRASVFDYILLETVGVGQSEVEIAGIADTTIVVMVPEAGDEVQTMKAGVMEIADIFVVNKADRANADEFVKNLKILSHSKATNWEIPVVKCVASQYIGIEELINVVQLHANFISTNEDRKIHLLTEKAHQLIQQKRMKDVSKIELYELIKNKMTESDFNVYQIVMERF